MRRPSLTLRRPLLHLLQLCAALLFAAQPGVAALDGGCKRPAAPQETFRAQGTLAPGRTVERELGVAEVHVYEVTLAAGQRFRAEVDELGANVFVVLISPGGQSLSRSNVEVRGTESAECVAEASGVYRLEIHGVPGPTGAGRYVIRAEDARPADARDRRRAEALRLIAEGVELGFNRNGADFRGAVAAYRKALAVGRELGDERLAALALYGLSLSHYSLGEMREAAEASREALPPARASGLRFQESEHHARLGAVADEWGDFKQALEHYERSLALRRALGARAAEAGTLSNIGHVHLRAGEFQKALDNFTLANRMARELGLEELEGVTLNNIAQVYLRLNDRPRARAHFEQTLALWRKTCNRWDEAMALTGLGNLFKADGETARAVDYLNQALAVNREVKNRAREALTLMHLGDAHLAAGQPAQAREHLTRAVEMFREAGNRYREGHALQILGRVEDMAGQERLALEHLERALALNRVSGEPWIEAETLYATARAAADLGDLERARAAAESALKLAESMRASVYSPALRVSYFTSAQKYYELSADVLMRLDERRPGEGFDARALHASEQARARGLLELLAEARADIREGVEPELLERERELSRRLAAQAERQARLAATRPAAAQDPAAASGLAEAAADYEAVQTELRRRSPRYAALTHPAPLSLQEIQHLLDPDTLLLEYALGEERSYLWAVSRDSLKSFRLPGRGEVEAAARAYYSLLTAPNEQAKGESAGQRRERLARAERDLPAAAGSLSKMILGPAAGLLGTKRLLVVGDGALHHVPFAALPDPNGAESGRREPLPSSPTQDYGPAPLVAAREIVRLPSASVLGLLRRELAERRPAPRLLALFADPVYDAADPRLRRARAAAPQEASEDLAAGATRAFAEAAAAGGDTIPRLPFSRREAEAIFALAPAGSRLKALDFDASQRAATDASLGQYRVLHFATHGLLNSRDPELSGVILSLFDERGRPVDGFLQLNEIYNLKLSADLVVLSACQTALGKEVRGEGLIGITRGFMYAGAARVAASLWKVDDAGTAELMRLFYEGMFRKGMRPAQALRAAQVAMMSQGRWRSPYHWAAFELQGEWR